MMQWKYKEKRKEDTDFINENYLFQKFQSFSLESIWIDRTLLYRKKLQELDPFTPKILFVLFNFLLSVL